MLDLLNTQNVDLPIRENKEKQIFVSGLTEKSIQNFEEFIALFQPASANRYVQFSSFPLSFKILACFFLQGLSQDLSCLSFGQAVS